MQIGGTEANVAAACARLGLRTAVISVLPSEHAWGDRTVHELTGHGVDCQGVLRRPGQRMGLYFIEYGVAPRPVRVFYDRRDSAFSRLVPDDVDWTLVRRARVVHLTGVTAALDGLRAAGATVVFEPVNQIGRARDATSTVSWNTSRSLGITESSALIFTGGRFSFIATRIRRCEGFSFERARTQPL